jgi:hypothetical protein
MKLTRRTKLFAVAAAVPVAVGVAVAVAAPPSTNFADVPSANTRSQGFSPTNKLSAGLAEIAIAQGSTKVENPGGVSYYGYDNDTLNTAGEPVMVASAATGNTEAHKTEPDKNVYLVFNGGLKGADPGYDYGEHFLFQGHEGGSPGNITRINLDADAAHRVTLLATQDSSGTNLATIDGVTWDPFARRLLFTTENQNAPTYSATPAYPSQVNDVSGALGRGGYEGIQDDSDGNLWIVEDIGGAFKGATTAKVPNSFLYRYVPKKPGDLANGKLQVLQVLNASNQPITQASQTALSSPDQIALHTYGSVFDTKWITIHDTAVNGNAPFNANLAAKTANGTPFKRPENGAFRPDGKFEGFYFDETGDTDATSPENDCCGGWTSVFKLTQNDPSSNTGKLRLFYKGDQAHAGFDNVAFMTGNLIAFVEDAGDKLHGQRNALDSGFLLDITKSYADPANVPIRWLAEGRDASATLDADNAGFGKNDGDNEITGIHVSDGDLSAKGILGARTPRPFQPSDDERQSGAWRVFWTQQHGDNPTWEVVKP